MGTHTNDVHTCTLCVPSGAHIHMTACTSLIFNVLPHTHTHTHTHTPISVQSQEGTQQSIWRELPDVPYYRSAVCVVDGVLLAIGGREEDDWRSKKKTSAIYALHPVDQKWQHIRDMPFECCYVDTLLLSGGRLLVVDGNSQKVLRVTVEGMPYKCSGQYY